METYRLDRDSMFLYGVTVGSFIAHPLPLTRKAVTFAAACHKHEVRKSNEPYISHPIAACNTLIILGIHEDRILSAMILHDVVENGHVQLATVSKEFGEEVAHLVDIQTKRDQETPEEYYARVGSEIGGILCKAADRLHNISNMVEVFELPRLKRYVDETERYVVEMIKNARYTYLAYANALVLMYEFARNIIKLAKQYIEAKEEVERLTKQINQ